MRFEFDNLDELKDFLAFVGDAREPVRNVGALVAEVPCGSLVANPEPLPEIEAPAAADEANVPPPTDATGAPPEQMRKRRTKAEMEAARAAESAAEETPQPQTDEPGAANPFAQPAGAAPVENVPDEPVESGPSTEAVQDAPDFIKSRLAERPEVSQVDHLNMARAFIGKHGMEKYNSSFALAGLTNNVMGYSVADCATHAAALDFLSLE